MQDIYRMQRSSGKVIFSQACVILFMGGGSGLGGLVPGGCLQFWGVSPIFLGGCLQFFGGVSNYFGGLQFFGGSPISQGGGVSPIFQGVSNFFFSFNFFPPKNSSGMHQPPTPLRRSMRGQYASYWNAFLFGKSTIVSFGALRVNKLFIALIHGN